MNRTLKTLLAAGVAVTTLGVGVAIAGPGFGPCGTGYGHGHHGMTFVQGQPGQGPMGGGMQPRLMQLDTDKDGAVSKAEFDSRFDQRFTALDTDKDGTVSEAEFMDAKAAALMGPGAGKGWAPSAMPEDMQALMQDRRAFMFRGLDADNSNTLSKEELAAHAGPRFEMMDANNDGKITADEMGRNGMWKRKGPGMQQPAAPAQ